MKLSFWSRWGAVSLCLALLCQPSLVTAQASLPLVTKHRADIAVAAAATRGVPPLIASNARRIAEVDLDLRPLLAPSALSRGRPATFVSGGFAAFQLARDLTVEVQGLRVEDTAEGNATWVGEIVWPEAGHAYVTRSPRQVFAQFELGTRRFVLQSTTNGQSFIREVNPSGLPGCLEDTTPASPTDKIATEPAGKVSAKNQNGRTIDLLALYTPAVANASYGDPTAMINNFVTGLNQSFANSGVNGAVRVVHYALAPGVQDPVTTDDYRVTAGKMQLSSFEFSFLSSLRDQHAADLVVLITHAPAGAEACGFAPALMTDNDPLSSINTSYAVVAANCAASDLTFTHEIGHTLGGKHDKPSYSRNEPAVYPIAYGFADRAGGSFRTIMGSSNLKGTAGFCGMSGCPRINFWSDPYRVIFIDGANRVLGSNAESDRSNMALTINGGTDRFDGRSYQGTLQAVVNHRTPNYPAPGIPGTPSTVPGFLTQVSWPAASGTVGWYELEEDWTSSFSYPRLAYRGSATQATVQVKCGRTYYWRVKACNGAGCSSYAVRGPEQGCSG